MSSHWSLATRGAVATVIVAMPVAGLGAYYRGLGEAGAFLYGVGVGLIVFVAIAVAVSLLTVRPTGLRILIGAGVYMGRLIFAAVAIGVPEYLGYLPVLPMVLGFAGVYMVENVALLWGASKLSGPSVARADGQSREVERRVEV